MVADYTISKLFLNSYGRKEFPDPVTICIIRTPQFTAFRHGTARLIWPVSILAGTALLRKGDCDKQTNHNKTADSIHLVSDARRSSNRR
jgi:hypothetical protein